MGRSPFLNPQLHKAGRVYHFLNLIRLASQQAVKPGPGEALSSRSKPELGPVKPAEPVRSFLLEFFSSQAPQTLGRNSALIPASEAMELAKGFLPSVWAHKDAAGAPSPDLSGSH